MACGDLRVAEGSVGETRVLRPPSTDEIAITPSGSRRNAQLLRLPRSCRSSSWSSPAVADQDCFISTSNRFWRQGWNQIAGIQSYPSLGAPARWFKTQLKGREQADLPLKTSAPKHGPTGSTHVLWREPSAIVTLLGHFSEHRPIDSESRLHNPRLFSAIHRFSHLSS